MNALLQNLTYRGLLSIINIVNNSFLLQKNDYQYMKKIGTL